MSQVLPLCLLTPGDRAQVVAHACLVGPYAVCHLRQCLPQIVNLLDAPHRLLYGIEITPGYLARAAVKLL